MERRIGAQEIALPDVDRAAREVRDLGARLLEDDDARRHVPRAEAHLPEAVEGSRGGPTEVERRGADAPDRLRLHEERAEVLQVDLPVLEEVGESGAEQRVLDPGRLRDV